MLSSCAVDPTLYAACDNRSKRFDDDNRPSLTMTPTMMTQEDAEQPDLCRHWSFNERLQCESKNPPPEFFRHFFPKRLGFNTPITRFHLRWSANFYSVICNFDEVMPY